MNELGDKYEKLMTEACSIYEYMSNIIDDDIAIATDRGGNLAVYVNRTGYMLAEARQLYNDSVNKEILLLDKNMTAKFTAKTQNLLIDSICSKEKFLVDHIEQLNKSAKYQLNFCITVISKCKEEMKYINYHQNG